MNHYLVIGVQRPPNSPSYDGDSYNPFHVNVTSEKELTFQELEKAFEEEVKILWSLIFDELKEEQDLKDWMDGEGYKHADYVLLSNIPFPDVDVYGIDLVNDYLGS